MSFIIDNPYYRATPSQNMPQLFCDNPLPSLDEFIKSKEEKLIIFEPWEADIPGPVMKSGQTVIDNITEQLKSIDPNRVTFITPNLDCNAVPFANKVLHYPYHFLDIQKKQDKLAGVTVARKKHFCSFNGAIKHKRIKFIKFCEEHNLIKGNYVSLVGTYDHGFKTDEKVNLYTLDKNVNEVRKDDKSVPLDIMKDSFLNVINETHEDEHVFFTEKTWKPILNFQVFLYYGVSNPARYYEELQKMGFQLYTEIINYDNDPLDELLKFTKMSISEIQQKISIYKLMMNKQLAESIDCNEIKKNLLYDKSI
tara:strand:- start:6005 stop:6931 length:927 start_codon:yes stop_codon:yes gene_type:complete